MTVTTRTLIESAHHLHSIGFLVHCATNRVLECIGRGTLGGQHEAAKELEEMHELVKKLMRLEGEVTRKLET